MWQREKLYIWIQPTVGGNLLENKQTEQKQNKKAGGILEQCIFCCEIFWQLLVSNDAEILHFNIF